MQIKSSKTLTIVAVPATCHSGTFFQFIAVAKKD